MCPGSHRDGLPDDDWRRTDFKRVPRDGGHGFQRMVGSHSTRSWAPATREFFVQQRPMLVTRLGLGMLSAWLRSLAMTPGYDAIRRPQAGISRKTGTSFFIGRCHMNSVGPLSTVCSGDQAAMATEFH
jgi:hypothetical protein